MAEPFGKGIARLCGVLAAPSARELRRSLALALRETPTAEIRLDWLKNDAERRGFLKWLKAHRPRKAQLIATCRRRVGGGGGVWGGVRRGRHLGVECTVIVTLPAPGASSRTRHQGSISYTVTVAPTC